MSEISETNQKEDFLEVDPKIPGQNFACMSFVSPEKVLNKKETFNTTKFLQYLFRSDDQLATAIKSELENKDVDISYNRINELYEDWKYSRTNNIVIKYPKT